MRNVVCFFIIAILFSCQKENIRNDKNIAAWTQHIPEQNRDLYQIRLAFGKTLAKALKERELRDFIKQQSKIQGERIYKELVFALIKDEVLPSGKTVMQVIRDHEDSEVKALFGETLMDRVANDDPMVVIKLPDLFYTLDWDTNDLIPFVGVQTPSYINNFEYAFYYHNGYNELIQQQGEDLFFENVKYFYLMVKYSTDHILLNVNNLTNEKNISLFELFPQFEYCTMEILSPILKSGTRNLENPNKIILNKLQCHQIWKDLCSYTGEFAYDDKPCGLPIDCPRNCDPDNPLNKNVVLTGFDVRNELFLLSGGNLFEESANVSIDFFKYSERDKLKRFVIPSFRYFKIEKFKVDITLSKKEMIFGETKFTVPLVSTNFQSINKKSKWIPINALMYDDISQDGSYFCDYCVNLVFYEDFVRPIDVSHELFYCYKGELYTGNLKLNLSRHRRVDGSNHDWCTNTDIFVSNFGIGISY